MTTENLKRKLTAILSADVEGYSRLMSVDEVSTIRTLKRYKEKITELVNNFRGRVVDAPGDNLLAEFVSVVDAVQCAVEIQREIAECNAEQSQKCKMNFRIGVNLGDVVEEDDRIYGDGVNIAARLESLCEGGGVCLSGSAYEQVENKLKLEFEDLGEHEVKNIKRPLRVYRVLLNEETTIHQLETASVEKMAFPLPEKPSIAVLPFDNMSGDPKQEYIADGISENITSALSCIPEMFVIARNSSFTYKRKPVKVQQVSQDLGVRYVLEGSVIKFKNKVRITAQLIDAITGRNMWSERYDRDLEDFFSLLDEIAMAVAVALQSELTDGEQARRWHNSTRNFDAWGYVVKGKSLFYKFGKQEMVKSRELFEQAVQIDPQYANAILWIAWTHKIDAHLGYTDSKEKSLKLSFDLAKKAVAMNDRDPNVHSLLSLLSLIQGDHEMAVAEGREAIALGPSDSAAHICFGEVLYQSGKFEEAVKMCERALRQHPYPPPFYLGHTLNAYYWTERYDESLALAERLIDMGLKVDNEWGVAWGLFGSALAKIQLGRLSEARQDANKLLKLWPWFDLDYFASIYHYKNSAHLERLIDVLRLAGIPEKEPLPLPEKPSVAVLPFENLTGNTSQEFIGDGIAESIIIALSGLDELFVITSNSTFSYKNKQIPVEQIGRELGVRFILCGSVLQAGKRIRITARLIEVKTGFHLWTDQFDRDMANFFNLLDVVAQKTTVSLQVELTQGPQARRSLDTTNFEAWGCYVKAANLLQRFTRQDNIIARELLFKAVEIDSDFAMAWVMLAWTYFVDVRFGFSEDPAQSIGKAIEIGTKARSMDNQIPGIYSFWSTVYLVQGEFKKAIEEGQKAVEIGPNNAVAHLLLCQTMRFVGRFQEAIKFGRMAIRLCPRCPAWYFAVLAPAYIEAGELKHGVSLLNEGLERSRKGEIPASHMLQHLAVAYIRLGQRDRARDCARKLMESEPLFSLSSNSEQLFYKDPKLKEAYLKDMKEAGLR